MLDVWLRSLHLVSSVFSFLVNSKKIINRKYSPILETIAQHENYLKHVVSTRCQCWCILIRVSWVVEFLSKGYKLDFIKQMNWIQWSKCISWFNKAWRLQKLDISLETDVLPNLKLQKHSVILYREVHGFVGKSL